MWRMTRKTENTEYLSPGKEKSGEWYWNNFSILKGVSHGRRISLVFVLPEYITDGN